jgi:hypothetical protein
MDKLEMTELKEIVVKDRKQKIMGWRFLDYINYIVALREMEVKHRVIADFLNEKLKLNEKEGITNNDLMAIVSYWKKMNLINFDEVKRIKADIQRNM